MKKWVVLGSVILIIAAAVGFYVYRQQQANIPSLKVIKVGRHSIASMVYATGTVDTLHKQIVGVVAPTLVKSVGVAVGQKVAKGDLLLQMDSTAIDLQVQQAQAAVNVATANAAAANSRLDELAKLTAGSAVPPNLIPGLGNLQGAITPDLLASVVTDAKNAQYQAQSMVKQAQSALAVLQNQQKATRITAAIAGTVLAVNVQANQAALPQSQLVVVGDLSSLSIKANINEVDAGKLAIGQPVVITGVTLGNKKFAGTVSSVAPMAQSEPTTQGIQTTVPIVVSVTKGDPALKPGFTVSLAITTVAKPAVLQVPLEAIFSLDNKSYVYVVKNNVIQQVAVTTGIMGDVNAEITSGLHEGDLVVLDPTNDLYTGLKVRVD
ncbi:MAG: efflux RND transporter periplasmic adaptor subunit [Peptococcaceae bacterium]|nr:efflux RND transporter periplasmic adaptor subunit [Peptococcaceae bacterium]